MAHGNIETLYEHVPKDLLPAEYGGVAGSVDEILDYWEDKLNEYRMYLTEECRFGTDEHKRAVPSELAQSHFGMTGVFKKLEFD